MENKRKSKSPLDSALRRLYYAFRREGAFFVAIEFTHRGRKWRVDTVDEAIGLRNRLDAEDGPDATWIPEIQDTHENAVEANRPNPWTPDLITELLNEAGELQKKFLLALTEHVVEEGKLTSAKLLKKLKLDSELALAGVISGLSKQLKKMSLSTHDVYTVEVSWLGKDKERSFRVEWNFVFSANALGWPEAWMGKKEAKE